MSAAHQETKPSAPITWTRFADQAAKTKREITQDWAELLDHLLNAGPYPSKHECPWLKLAVFGNVRTDKEALRNNRNVLKVTGVEGDYDQEKVRPEEAVALLERAHLRAIVYTSPSHKTEAPRWRVLCPLATPAHPDERSRLLARVNGALGGVLSAESFTLSQSYFYGRVLGQDDYRVLATFDDPADGVCVDEANELDAVAVIASAMPNGVSDDEVPAAHCIAEAVKLIGRPLRTGDNRRALLRRYIGSRSNIGLSPSEINALVGNVAEQYFDPADPIDEANVHELIDHICSADRQEREEIDRTVGGFIRKASADGINVVDMPAPKAVQINILNLISLHGYAPQQIDWVWDHWIAKGTVTSLYGAGGVGKSLLSLQIAAAVVQSGQLFGVPCSGGRALALYCEDDVREIHRRMWRMAEETSLFRISDLAGRLDVDARAGMDNVLIQASDTAPTAAVTALFAELRSKLKHGNYDLLVLDNIAQMMGIPENKRSIVTQAVNILTQLAIEFNIAILLLGHPAKAIGSQFSGSTAWDAAVRARLLLERDQNDENILYLRKAKANYSKLDVMQLRYECGRYIRTDGEHMDFIEKVRRSDALKSAESAVMLTLHEAAAQGFSLTDAPRSPDRFLIKVGRLWRCIPESIGDQDVIDAIGRLMRNGVVACEMAKIGKSNRPSRVLRIVS